MNFSITLLIVFIFLMNPAVNNDTGLKTGNLTCNFLNNPVAVETVNPKFSWQLTSPLRNQYQSSYRILVADNEKDIHASTGTTWDSGKVESDQSVMVDYKGPVLIAGRKYFWKVKAWSRDGKESPWSNPSSFNMGLLTEKDWNGARWIGYEDLADSLHVVPGVHGNGDRLGKKAILRPVVPLFRKEFRIDKKISSAFLYISGAGQYEATVNGKKAGDGFLTPGWTHFDSSVFYNCYDVTESIKKGANALGVMVGNGFYNINRERYRKLVIAYGMPKMICRLTIRYSDGTEDKVVSDLSWKTAPSPVTYTSIYGGEDYDARQEQPGWNLPGFNDSKWKNVIYPAPPGGRLTAEADFPMKVMETFEPLKIYESKPDTFLYDFGQNASGIVQIKVKGKKGQVIKLIPSELINEKRLANQRASGGPYYFQYTLKGTGEETWQPRFTYYGFRYVQVEGAVPVNLGTNSGKPLILEMKFLHTRNSAPDAGRFSCSYDLFNRTNELIRWAIKSNLQSVMTDCPHREKLGWLEQTYLMGGSVHFNFDLYQLYSKQVSDMMEAQLENGLVPDIAPEYVPFEGGFRDSPEWGSAAVILPWMIYKWYGDKTVMEKAWPMMTRYVKYLKGKSNAFILSHGLGDWFDYGPNRPGEAQLTPKTLTATAIWYYDVSLLCDMAQILNKPDDKEWLTGMAGEIKSAFLKKFFNPETGVISTGSQTAMSMPWCVGLIDPPYREKVMQNLEDSVRLQGKPLTAGDVGFHFLVEALTRSGRSQLLYEMMARDDVPGYGYQLKKGATALTESWPALEVVSNNHLMLGHLMEWFYAGLGGIGQSPQSAGYREMVIKPEFPGDMTGVETSHRSPYGEIRSSWQKLPGKTILNIHIPANSGALVHIPAGSGSVITENGIRVEQASDIQSAGEDNGRKLFRIGSGNYTFQITR